MPFTPQHSGLYFTAQHIAEARRRREEPPFEQAWTFLHEREQGDTPENQWNALRYAFDEDIEAGAEAVAGLLRCADQPLDESLTYFEAVREMLVQAHAFELVHTHPAFDDATRMRWRGYFRERVQYLTGLAYERSYVEALWTDVLRLIAGIVLNDDLLFHAGVQAYQRAIREDIHPQGYIPKAVEARDGGGLLRQVLSVEALVLMAEAGTLSGAGLWDYSFRSVSVMTAFSYLLYYYYYPEKWRWDEGVTVEPFREYGGFLEIVNHHAYPKDLKPLLEDLRPIYDAPGGGLTTLSHGVARKRGLFR